MTEIVFRDPPPAKKVRRDWEAIADQLKAHPGRWACIDSSERRAVMGTMATRINRSVYRGFAPAGTFEAVARESRDVPGRWELFARYVGHRDGL